MRDTSQTFHSWSGYRYGTALYGPSPIATPSHQATSSSSFTENFALSVAARTR